MSRARHHERKRAMGGLTSKPQWNAGGTQNAAKEAEERKHGGRAKHHMHGEGEHAKKRADRRARGGKVGSEEHHAVKGHSMHHRHGMSIPGRKRGGSVGADKHPLTSAANVKHVISGETPEEGVPSD